ncbi:DUF2931 family protein [Pseudomonas sp. NPDC007930]|uniref:DUF2931 family protein n=1 Tax=Pseudomonas sp. NPDC007930 TaxID=3364417 RepID=UPI0036E5F273
MALGKALRASVGLLGCLLLSGCATGPGGLPYDAWRLGLLAPNYMQAWIETVDVVDIQGRVFRSAMWGTPSINAPEALTGNPRGWPASPGWGKGRYVRGAALPMVIYVRWQSLIEPQTYEALIPIPEATRQQMVAGEKVPCAFSKQPAVEYRLGLNIGLAPGGIAKAWISGPCLKAIEVNRIQAQIVALGPDQGRSNGQYALPLYPQTKTYIEKNGIPYGSW